MKRCLNCMKEYNEYQEVCPYCGYMEGEEPKEVFLLRPGTILHNQYVIGTKIGVGGFGIVYKAWDKNLSRMVAIKEYFQMGSVSRIPGHKEVMIFKNHKQEYNRAITRFLDEAQYLAKFSTHPNVVNVYSFFEENNTAYIVMEYLDGVSYKEFIKSQINGIVEIDSAVSVVVAVLEALREIHKYNIIHRDVAPDNIFICWDGRIKLMDFGSARLVKKDEMMEVELKPGFAPPEQYAPHSQLGVYTDIYAVGAVLYRSLTGKMPIEGSNRLEQDELIPPNEANPNIPEKLNNIILRAMAIQPDLRFKTDNEFIEVLNENFNGKIRSIKEEIKHRKKMRLIKSLIAAFVLCIGGAIGFYIYDFKKSEIDLKPTTLEVWLQAENRNTSDTTFRSALSEFTEKYPQVNINITVIPKDQYEGKLMEASKTNDMPDVYETIENLDLPQKDISRIAKYLEPAQYDGLGILSHEEIWGMPITYNMPVVYVSKTVEGYSEAEAKVMYENLLSDGVLRVQEDEVIRFLKGETPYVVADTSYYWAVQEQQGGKYEMKPIPGTDRCQVGYSMILAVDDGVSRAQYNAAIQMIFYLLGEKAQSKLCIEQHQGLPLQKDIYERFIQLNAEYQELDAEKENLMY